MNGDLGRVRVLLKPMTSPNVIMHPVLLFTLPRCACVAWRNVKFTSIRTKILIDSYRFQL
jgi:hypothetical protein